MKNSSLSSHRSKSEDLVQKLNQELTETLLSQLSTLDTSLQRADLKLKRANLLLKLKKIDRQIKDLSV